MDYSLSLAIVLAVTGAIWLGESWSARERRQAGGPPEPRSWLLLPARTIFVVVLGIALVRSSLLEPYEIPSGSMMPSLVAGDFILVSKFSYGLRMPFSEERFLPVGAPRRGDVVVFRSPTERKALVKRLVGLPGDHVQVSANRIRINGELVPMAAGGAYDGVGGFAGARLAREDLGQHQHDVLLVDTLPSFDFDAIVPPNAYFFMGDNRNDSQDSRYPQVGFVPEENLIGPALIIWMSWQGGGGPDWQRIGRRIR